MMMGYLFLNYLIGIILYKIKTSNISYVTYFTVKFSYELLKKHGLEIMDVDVVNYHGGSLRVFGKKER